MEAHSAMGFSWGRFDTRTIVLIPIAIAINIVLGQTVGAALKIPIYLDSIGTILVGVLAGPIPGLVTGLLANLIWTYVLPAPLQSPYAAPFAIVAAEIGFVSGLFGQFGFFRSRPNSSGQQLVIAAAVAIVVVGVLALYTVSRFYTGAFTFFNPEGDQSPFFQILGWIILVGIIATIVGFLVLLFVRRDAGVAYVVIAGVVMGIISALISAPISAVVFGGVTGSGTDLLVAAFQQGGSDLQTAVLQQGLLSDPIDKVVTSFIVFLLLQSLSRRFIARFPQGEKAVGLEQP
jgi:energy-coupling factor transport system substrate-specific component